ncbi:MAG TPA: translation elongation factor-like protein [Candidatus Latescibacteria bacterium]|nr:translation elongation factor-like protein [Candidatus Latescibacterota bacterium]
MTEEEIGKVSGYFAKIGVAGIKITSGTVRIGDTIHIKGHTTDFQQQVESIQIEHESVEQAGPGDLVGIKVKDRVRPNDVVYKVSQ